MRLRRNGVCVWGGGFSHWHGIRRLLPFGAFSFFFFFFCKIWYTDGGRVHRRRRSTNLTFGCILREYPLPPGHNVIHNGLFQINCVRPHRGCQCIACIGLKSGIPSDFLLFFLEISGEESTKTIRANGQRAGFIYRVRKKWQMPIHLTYFTCLCLYNLKS